MLRNYISVVLRNMGKNKFYSFVSVFGLALGLSFFFLVLSFIDYENSYDKFHENKNEIFKVELQVYDSRIGGVYERSATGASIAPLLKNEFPAIKSVVRFANYFTSIVGTEDKSFKEKRFVFADADIFNVFTFPLLKGNKETALLEPFSVVLTKDCAKKYFGDDNPIGKTISYNRKDLNRKLFFKVTGVLDDIPSNSTLQFDFLASFETLSSIMPKIKNGDSWEGPIWTYIKLANANDSFTLQSGFHSFVEKYIPVNDFNIKSLSLIPLTETYYHRSDGVAAGDRGMKIITYFVLFIAFVVLIMAAANFASLLTARSITRRKEIGVRKVHGASRSKLISQFVGESVVMSFFSFLFSIIIIVLFISSFQQFLGSAFPTMNILPERKVDIGIFNLKSLFQLFGLSVLTGIIAGVYPAIVSSKVRTASILKGDAFAGRHSTWFRKTLLVLQFTVSIVFINCSLNIIRFIDSMNNTEMGFDTNNIIAVPVYDAAVTAKFPLLKSELLNNPAIENVTAVNSLPGGVDLHIINVRTGDMHNSRELNFSVDSSFVKTAGLKIVQGDNFNSYNSSDGILISAKTMKDLSLANPVGEKLEMYYEENAKDVVLFSGRIIGVFEDFKYSFSDKRDEGAVIRINPAEMNYVLIKNKEGKNAEALSALKAGWNGLNIKQQLEYSSLKDEINAFSSILSTVDTSVRFASFLSILIACSGLLAISSFIIERRNKEIGIRKVMGGSVKDIIIELTGSFLGLVVIANIIAVPVSYLILSGTIFNRTDVHFSIWTFIAAMLTSFVLAVLIVGVKSYKAATVNPVLVLRSE